MVLPYITPAEASQAEATKAYLFDIGQMSDDEVKVAKKLAKAGEIKAVRAEWPLLIFGSATKTCYLGITLEGLRAHPAMLTKGLGKRQLALLATALPDTSTSPGTIPLKGKPGTKARDGFVKAMAPLVERGLVRHYTHSLYHVPVYEITPEGKAINQQGSKSDENQG